MDAAGHDYALVLAGGSGLRFWPLSRRLRPKQMLDLFGDGCMLTAAVKRALRVVGRGHVFIQTNEVLRREVVAQLRGLVDEAHVIAEPVKRDTGPAVALGIGLIGREDRDARMLVMPSDALIGDDVAFARSAEVALELAGNSGALVTIGIRPSWGCPSYGYIERGDEVTGVRQKCFKVKRFCEKPDAVTAAAYAASDLFCWNAGIFVWSARSVLTEMDAACPELAEFARGVMYAEDARGYVREKFAALSAISIDYALMEKARNVLNLEASFEWDDVGSWLAVGKRLPRDNAGNAANTPLVTVDAHDNIVYGGGKQVALLGVEGLIVVETPDALLVARREDADRIKQVVTNLPPSLL